MARGRLLVDAVRAAGLVTAMDVQIQLTRPAVLDGEYYDAGAIVDVSIPIAWQLRQEKAGEWVREE